jgi:hypothetical protein
VSGRPIDSALTVYLIHPFSDTFTYLSAPKHRALFPTESVIISENLIDRRSETRPEKRKGGNAAYLEAVQAAALSLGANFNFERLIFAELIC